MTSPSGHGSNDINLAALWIPVMPETSHMGEEMRKAGGEAKRQFEQGFNSGTSPESLGSSFGSKFTASINKEFKNFELPFGANAWVDRMSADIDKKLVGKLSGQATEALSKYRQEYDNLTAAQGRATEAENKITAARQGGANQAQILIPLMREHAVATKDVETAHNNAALALNNYKDKASQLHEAQGDASRSGTALAGIMGGLVVVGATMAVHAVESLVEGIGEGFKSAIEITTELAKRTIELGETYEHIGIQVTEFSNLSGEAFKKTEEAAQEVFSTLDVAGNDTGKTMGQLATMLDAPGESIKGLVRQLTELQGRYTSLKTADLASIFVAFKTPAKEADSALASFLQSARGSGQDLGQLASTLSGNVAYTMKEAGLSIQQAGKFTAELLAMGEPGRQAMGGMATAMKEFKKEDPSMSFAEGMKLAGERLKALGDTAAGQDLAQTLFGGRNWIVAKNAVSDYLDVVEKGPDAFNATSASTDEFLNKTADLGNKIEEFKHKAEGAFKPFGDAARTAVQGGLSDLSRWFDTHRTDIIETVKGWGDRFIAFLPQLKEFAVDSLRIFGDLAAGLAVLMVPIADQMGIAGAGLLALTGHFKEAGNLLGAIGKLDVAAFTGKIATTVNDMADKIQGMNIDSQAIAFSWDSAANAALRIPPSIGNSVQGNPFGMEAGAGAPGAFPAPIGAPPSTASPGGAGGIFAGPGGAAPGNPTTALGPGGHHADWDAIAKLESSNRWNEILSTGIALGGGLQIKPETWYEFGGLKYSQYAYQATKDQQIEIAERILNGWGSVAGQGPKAWENGSTYVEKKALGGAPGRSITSGSGQGDDVAALLGRGEYVWDTETMDKHGWLVKALHQGGGKGFDQGGSGLDTQGAQVDTIAVAEAAKQLFGISDIGMWRSADGYNEHASGEAADIMVGNNKAAGDAVAQYFLAHAAQFGVQYVLWQQAQWNPDGTHSGMSDRGGATANHLDHVHVRTLGGGFPQGQIPKGFAAPHTGQTSNTPSGVAAFLQGYGVGGGGTLPAGQNGLQFPGMAGQYGGSGVYGGETADQAFSAQQAVQAAQDRQADLDYQVQQNQKKIDDLKAQLAQVGTDPGKVGDLTQRPIPRTPAELAADDAKRKQLNDELDAATHTLTISQRDQSEQGGKLTEAQRKQQEAMYKKPSSATTSGGQTTEGKLGQDLGSGLLSGIGQELGFGDVLGKSPLDWGIVKLFGSLFGYANNLGNAVSQATGGSVGGLAAPGGGGMGGGMLSGLTGSLGIPKMGVSSGPNIQSGAPGTPASGMGAGPLPGPPGMVIQGDFQPIHVSPNVDPKAILGPVNEQRNSDNAALHGQTGGLPK